MKKLVFCSLFLFGTFVIASDDDTTELKAEMHKECASLFAEGASCANLAMGTRNCVRQNLATAEKDCVEFEQEHKEFFDAGKDDPIVQKDE